MLTYGSEAWCINEAVAKKINGANASMMSVITGKTQHQEATTKWQTFDLVKWIRARRLQWLGHILRMGKDRQLKQAIFEMFKRRREGDMLMDAPQTESWWDLCSYAIDRKYWKARVRAMKQPRVGIEIKGPQVEASETLSFTISS